MPPYGAVIGFGDLKDDTSLTQEQLELITDWVEGGAPEGDANLLPKEPAEAGKPVSKPESDSQFLVSGNVTLTHSETLLRQSPAPAIRSGAPPALISAATQQGPRDYVCPMDADVRSDKPGVCPRCGMTLRLGIADQSEFPLELTTEPAVLRPGGKSAPDIRVEKIRRPGRRPPHSRASYYCRWRPTDAVQPGFSPCTNLSHPGAVSAKRRRKHGLV